jgi:hypothetical protein
MLTSDLAKQIDCSPRDVLDAALDAGINRFTHEGERFSAFQIKHHLEREHRFDPVPDIEFEPTLLLLLRLGALDGSAVLRLLRTAQMEIELLDLRNGPNNGVAKELQRLRDMIGAAA